MQLDDVLIEIDLSTGRLHDDKGWPIGGSHGKTVFKGLTVFDIVDDFCTPENIRKRDIASIDSSSLSSSSTSSSSSSSSPSSSSSSPAGAIGPVGAVGTDGPAGAAGIASLSEFAFIYNLAAQVVAVESAVVFSDNGVLSAGITHALNTAGVTHQRWCLFDFSVSGTEPNQFGLFANGVVVPGTVYGSGAGVQQYSGNIIATFVAGSVITLQNHSSAASVTLAAAAPIGGTQQATNASLRILRIS